MGSLFSAPKPVIVQAPPAPPTPAIAVTPSPDQIAAQARTQAQAQAQAMVDRGLAGTIATSPVGVLDTGSLYAGLARKTLLGE
jgi:hypothetical protein